MQVTQELVRVLKAQQPRWPFVLLSIMTAVTILAGIWVFLRTADFSMYSAAVFFGGLLIFIVLMYYLTVNFKIGQSIELTDDGVWSLAWVKPTKLGVWPRLEKRLFRWTDLQRWKMRGHVIYLYGAERSVAINTILFEDGNEVVRFINRITKAA